MSITPLKFTGISSFSEDFQTILSRAVQIASLPVKALQSDQSDLLARKASLSNLRTMVADLAVSLEAIAGIGQNRSLNVTSSNTSRVSVTNNGVTASGVYTISEISSMARAASENFLAGVDTPDSSPVDGDGELELVFGTSTYTISLTPSTNNLTGLRDAVNNLGAGLTASIINSGEPSGGYYLSITAQKTGATALQLNSSAGDASSNLLTSENQGANATFKLNGIAMSRPDNTITDAISGLTFTILGETAPGETVQIAAASSRGSLATAFSQFAAAYNRVADAVNAQIGENAGILSGDTSLREIQTALRAITGYSPPSGEIRSIAALGLELDKTGKMSFNSAKFYSLSNSAFESALDFAGTPATGFGALAKRLDQISNPVSGIIRTQQNSIDAADKRIGQQISAIQERISNMQASLAQKLQQADVLISQLSAQQNQLTAIVRSLNTVTFGKEKQ